MENNEGINNGKILDNIDTLETILALFLSIETDLDICFTERQQRRYFEICDNLEDVILDLKKEIN